MNELIQDPAFFYAVAFTAFVVLAFVFGRKPALSWIDGQIAEIRAELDQAHHLRAEAEAALAACKERQASAEAETQEIMKSTQRQVEAMRGKAQQELAASIARHQQMSEERIRIAEQDAIRDVRHAAIELAVSLARKTMAAGLSPDDAARLVEQAIADLSTQQNRRAA